MEIDREFPNGLTQISSHMETEFAGCLLMVGPPDVIGSGKTEAQRCDVWDGDVQPTDTRVGAILDSPVSSMDYMMKCEVWHRKHVPQRAGIGVRGGYTYRTSFDVWWHEYKTWLLENRRGD